MGKLRLLLLLNSFILTSHSSILPENNFAIPISEKNEGLTEAQYNLTIDKVEKVYRPIVEKLGLKLKIERLWTNSRVNAGTVRAGKEVILRMYGGYARHPLITEDAFTLVLCHELGHHLGGSPRKDLYGRGPEWPSTEGQADYFATLKCLRKVFRKENNTEVVQKLEVPELIQTNCSKSFPVDWEAAICIRTSIAGLKNSYISAHIRGIENPQIETPDSSMVEKTYEGHPIPQCRLDTYFQGSVCEVPSNISVSDTNEVTGTCHQENGNDMGLRPACWFKPR
jgi:hypothetical protein